MRSYSTFIAYSNFPCSNVFVEQAHGHEPINPLLHNIMLLSHTMHGHNNIIKITVNYIFYDNFLGISPRLFLLYCVAFIYIMQEM